MNQNDEIVNVKTLSEQFNMNPKTIRKVFRANGIKKKPIKFPGGVPSRYYWTKDDPELQKICDSLK